MSRTVMWIASGECAATMASSDWGRVLGAEEVTERILYKRTCVARAHSEAGVTWRTNHFTNVTIFIATIRNYFAFLCPAT